MAYGFRVFSQVSRSVSSAALFSSTSSSRVTPARALRNTALSVSALSVALALGVGCGDDDLIVPTGGAGMGGSGGGGGGGSGGGDAGVPDAGDAGLSGPSGTLQVLS